MATYNVGCRLSGAEPGRECEISRQIGDLGPCWVLLSSTTSSTIEANHASHSPRQTINSLLRQPASRPLHILRYFSLVGKQSLLSPEQHVCTGGAAQGDGGHAGEKDCGPRIEVAGQQLVLWQ